MKVLFAGLGGVGQRHLRNLRALRGDDVEVLAFRQRGLSRTLTNTLGVEADVDLEAKYRVRTFRELDAALAEKPSAVFITNPSSLHVPIALAAAKAGCHLFVEKPLSHDLEGLDELIAVAEEKKLATLVGYQLRFHPLIALLRERLPAIGPVIAVKAEVGEWLPGWHPYEDYREMYAARRDLGGGVVLSQIHELDYLYSLFGVPKRIFALGGHLSSLEVDVEDVASISLAYELAGRRVPAHLHADYIQRPPARTCVVIGDQGRIALDFHALSFRQWDKGTLVLEKSFAGFERNQLFLDEMQHFLDCMSGKAESVVTLRDGRESLRMALAAKESIATGKVVELA